MEVSITLGFEGYAMPVAHWLICCLYIVIAFDEKTFARKVVKIYRTIRKMEYTKNQEPNFS